MQPILITANIELSKNQKEKQKQNYKIENGCQAASSLKISSDPKRINRFRLMCIFAIVFTLQCFKQKRIKGKCLKDTLV